MMNLFNTKHLNESESYELFKMFNHYTQEKKAAILGILRAREESTDEILGALRCFNESAISIDHPYDVLDIVGTGGDGLETFNISTTVALLLASLGVDVAKHGGKSASGKVGSADLINSLGLQISEDPNEHLKNLAKYHFTFIRAGSLNGGLQQHGTLRQNLGFPSMFNIIGPLLNPMRPKRVLIGVYRKDLLAKVADILTMQGIHHALVVYGEPGMDEFSICGASHVIEIKEGKQSHSVFQVDDFGLQQAPISSIQIKDGAHNLELVLGVLNNQIQGPPLDIVVLNAAAGLYLAGVTKDIKESILIIKSAIQNGVTSRFLKQIRGEI
jgi:anthranilate phosphoribosyltransferase